MDKNNTDCSIVNEHTDVCSSEQMLKYIAKFCNVPYKPGTYNDAVKRKQLLEIALQIANVNTEADLYSSDKFRNFITNNSTSADIRTIDEELDENFKPVGPKKCCKLFSNFNIQDALKMINKKYPNCYIHPCNMINFQEYGDTLSKTDPNEYFKNGINCFACVMNTDVNTGKGKHWIAIFGDFRQSKLHTIEFFNSTGNGPGSVNEKINAAGQRGDIYALLMDYLDDLAKKCESISGVQTRSIITTDVNNPHQKSHTECGPYSVYYIYKRLEGTPYKYFRDNRVPDDIATQFRSVLFRE